MIRISSVVVLTALTGASFGAPPDPLPAAPSPVAPPSVERSVVVPVAAAHLERRPSQRSVERAREEVLRGVRYSRAYEAIPGAGLGDVASDRSACTDLVVRALRAGGLDLQANVFADVSRAGAEYGLERADPTIDHRRAATLLRWFERHFPPLVRDADQPDFEPGDVVFYSWSRCARRSRCAVDHVSLVSDRRGRSGRWMVLQNGGPRAAENDSLARGAIVGHFRPFLREAGAPEPAPRCDAPTVRECTPGAQRRGG